MKPTHPLHGLLNLAIVERQAAHLEENGVTVTFIGGSTGECHSLSLEGTPRAGGALDRSHAHADDVGSACHRAN